MIDIIICTYNRPQKILELVHSLLPNKSYFNRIIVVDSSDSKNKELAELNELVYIKSNHKNQPYQRLLGYYYAT